MPKIWMYVLSIFAAFLLLWAIFGVTEMQYRISIFAVIGAILTAITSVLMIVINNKEIHSREMQLMIRKEQKKVFDHFYATLFEILRSIKNSDENDFTDKAIEEMHEFKQGLMNWGSEDLISDYLDYENSIIEAASSGTAAILEVGDKFLKSIRKELGFEDTGSVNLMSVVLTAKARKDVSE